MQPLNVISRRHLVVLLSKQRVAFLDETAELEATAALTKRRLPDNIVNKTLAGPYTLRPAPGAPVSIPIAWEELDDPRLRPDGWNIRNAEERVRATGDLFRGLLRQDQDLPLS